MNLEDKDIKKFLQTHPKTNFMQSPEWAKVKTDWKNEFIVVRDENNKVKGTMSILLRKVPIFNRYIMYAPRGFVCDIYDKETLKELTEKAKEIAKKYKAFIFRLDPDVLENDEKFKNTIKELGYKTKKNIKNIDQVIQPKYVFRLDIRNKTEDEVLQSFESKTRYNIRLAGRKGVTVREGKREDLKIFHNIMKTTGSRDDFFIRPLEYFEKIYDEMSPNHVKLIIAEYANEPIAAVLPILYGDKVWYLYGGSSNKHRNLMPNYLLQWEMIKWAISNKCNWYDFRGISGFKNENDPQYGVYKFKKGFNPTFMEFINEMYVVYNPVMNAIFNVSKGAYNKLSRIKNKFKKEKN